MRRPFTVCVLILVLNSCVIARSESWSVYDRQQFQSIVSALTRFDPELYHSQEHGWRGLIAYYQEGGGLADRWGGTPSK